MFKLLFSFLIGSFVLSSGYAQITFQPLGVPFKAPVTVASGYSASVLFSNLSTPRGIAIDSEQNILVVERGFGVTAFSPTTSPSAGWERTVVFQDTTLTQGIQVDGNKLYVSSASQAVVYTYDATTKSIQGTASTVVSGLPPDGDLTTHTLQLDKTGSSTAILIASGPFTNIDVTARDPASGRSQIRRFVLGSTTQAWSSGQVVAYGIRNPAGFAFPPTSDTSLAGGRNLYVVENGASIDNVTGLTAAFVNDNPADELEKVAPKFYGFPDCTTLWNPNADPVGVPQYTSLPKGAQISLKLDPTRDDAWCQIISNNQPPSLSFQAHSVPLDIKFYTSKKVTSNGLPLSLRGDAFVSFHGSFNRSPPTGYGVIRYRTIPLQETSSITTLPYSFIIQAAVLTTCPGNCIRPVGLVFGADNRLYVTSDSSGELFVIEKST
ncbi:soluble quino protein glucose/sorbosone dehydrogenase [Cyathus striatus]|nr:soluble quino protein glucose/sorbosone dehydrogenase [Cyathus striatus]